MINGGRTHRLHPRQPPHADAAGELPLQELYLFLFLWFVVGVGLDQHTHSNRSAVDRHACARTLLLRTPSAVSATRISPISSAATITCSYTDQAAAWCVVCGVW